MSKDASVHFHSYFVSLRGSLHIQFWFLFCIILTCLVYLLFSLNWGIKKPFILWDCHAQFLLKYDKSKIENTYHIKVPSYNIIIDSSRNTISQPYKKRNCIKTNRGANLFIGLLFIFLQYFGAPKNVTTVNQIAFIWSFYFFIFL